MYILQSSLAQANTAGGWCCKGVVKILIFFRPLVWFLDDIMHVKFPRVYDDILEIDNCISFPRSLIDSAGGDHHNRLLE